MVSTTDMVYTVSTIDTVDTVYTIQTAFHCLNSGWVGRTDEAEIANMGYVVDKVEGADWADKGDGADGS